MYEFSGIGSKIASWKEVGAVARERGLNPVKWVREGWNELGRFSEPHFASKGLSRGWMGTGDITRHLPVGPKSFVVGAGALLAPSAFAKEDPTGEGLSRARRIGGWVGGNLLGVAATLPSRAGFIPTLGLGIAGSLAGDYIGRRVGGLFEGSPSAPRVPNTGN